MKVITQDGIEYYEKENGTLVIKSVHDNLYGVGRVKEVIKPFGEKGQNPCKKLGWQKDLKSY